MSAKSKLGIVLVLANFISWKSVTWFWIYAHFKVCSVASNSLYLEPNKARSRRHVWNVTTGKRPVECQCELFFFSRMSWNYDISPFILGFCENSVIFRSRPSKPHFRFVVGLQVVPRKWHILIWDLSSLKDCVEWALVLKSFSPRGCPWLIYNVFYCCF